MAASPQQDPPDDELFGNVARLEPNGSDAARKLRAVHDELTRLGADADAERLLALDKAAERGDLGTLERMISAEHPLDQLTDAQHARVRTVVGWRNAIALVPLLITWFFLGWASWRYHRQVDAEPDLSTQPFLVLWEQRFGGQFIPTFSETAIFAFGLLLLVLIFTTWAHHRETRANRLLGGVRGRLDEAMAALALATQTSSIRPPVTAEEWAEAAQRVLTETQRLIESAVRDTRSLAEANLRLFEQAQQAATELHTTGREQLVEIHTKGREELAELHAKGREAMTALQEQGREFVGGLAEEALATMVAVRSENAQLIAGTAEQARVVLQQAGEANRQLVEQQMTPLFEGFRESLRDYRADQESYRTSAAAMASGVTELTTAAQALGASAETYATTAVSIDQHLRLIKTSQSDFVERVTENSASMTTAATAMREVTEAMSGRMRTDLETLARNIVQTTGRLAAVDRGLVATSAALEATTVALQRAAADLTAVTAALATPGPRRSWWRRLFGR
ncbi:MAG TPA: hypothetical protein VGD43_06995 [Micromonospora sp.]